KESAQSAFIVLAKDSLNESFERRRCPAELYENGADHRGDEASSQILRSPPRPYRPALRRAYEPGVLRRPRHAAPGYRSQRRVRQPCRADRAHHGGVREGL